RATSRVISVESWSGPARARGGARSLFQPLDVPAQHAAPQLVLQHLVLDAVLEVGIVVDLDDVNALVVLLEVDAVEAVADGPSSLDGGMDDSSRHSIDGEGLISPLLGLADGRMLDNRPILERLQVQAGEQRLAVLHADPTEELGIHVSMGKVQVGVLE